jgi:hypothetical protein
VGRKCKPHSPLVSCIRRSLRAERGKAQCGADGGNGANRRVGAKRHDTVHTLRTGNLLNRESIKDVNDVPRVCQCHPRGPLVCVHGNGPQAEHGSLSDRWNLQGPSGNHQN